jgi:hypothetical protein
MNIDMERGRTAWLGAKEDDDSNLPRSQPKYIIVITRL